MLGLITDSVIEDILVVLEQDFNPSKVVVAVSGDRKTLWIRSTSVEASGDHGDRKTLALALLWRLHGFLKTKLGVGAVAVCLSKLDGLYGR